MKMNWLHVVNNGRPPPPYLRFWSLGKRSWFVKKVNTIIVKSSLPTHPHPTSTSENDINVPVVFMWCVNFLYPRIKFKHNTLLILDSTCKSKVVSFITRSPVHSRTGGTLTKSFLARSNRKSPPEVENLNRILSGKELADRLILAWFWSRIIWIGTNSENKNEQEWDYHKKKWYIEVRL